MWQSIFHRFQKIGTNQQRTSPRALIGSASRSDIRIATPNALVTEMFNRIKRYFSKPRNTSGHVYYARLATPQGIFYKLGYTSKPSLVERMAFGEHGDEQLIDRELFFTFRDDAWDVEQTLLDHFDRFRAFGKYSNDPKMPLSGRGQSELFAHDILGLDYDLDSLSEDEKKAIREHATQTGEGCLLVVIGIILAPFTIGLSLFLIAGGLSGVFAIRKDRNKTTKHPVHPPNIRKLICELNVGNSCPSADVAPR